MTRLARISVPLLVLALGGCVSSGGSMPQSHPHDAAQLNAQMGLEYMEQGNDELAMEKLQHALELDPHSADANHYMALLDVKLGRNNEAEDHYRRALSEQPNDPNILNNYGLFLCRQKRLDEARDKFLAAAKQPFYRTPEVAYTNAGICAMEVPDFKKAEEYLRAALRQNPAMPDALYEMAHLSFEQKQDLHARAFVQRYLEVAPAGPQLLLLAVRIERRLGDETSAMKYANQLRSKFPTSPEADALDEAAP